MKAVVKDVMSVHPVSVSQDTPFRELAARLSEFAVSGFPVVDPNGKVIGVVSAGDLMAKEALAEGYHGWRRLVAPVTDRTERRKAHGVTAGDLMTSPAITVGAGDTVEHAAALMYGHGLGRLPVVDAAGRLAGIISRIDVLAVFDRRDEDIRQEIIREVIPPLAEPSWYLVRVKDGIVTIEGTPETVPSAAELLARISHVQGVVAVRDRLPGYPRRRHGVLLAG